MTHVPIMAQEMRIISNLHLSGCIFPRKLQAIALHWKPNGPRFIFTVGVTCIISFQPAHILTAVLQDTPPIFTLWTDYFRLFHQMLWTTLPHHLRNLSIQLIGFVFPVRNASNCTEDGCCWECTPTPSPSIRIFVLQNLRPKLRRYKVREEKR